MRAAWKYDQQKQSVSFKKIQLLTRVYHNGFRIPVIVHRIYKFINTSFEY